VPPAPSVRINTVRPSWPPWAVHGNCANASADHADVIGGGVGPSISRPEQERQRFPGAPGAVVNEREQRVKPEASLVGRGGVFLLRVRPHQARVQIDDHRVAGVHPVIGGVGTGPRPRRGAAGGPRGVNRRQRPRRILGQGGDQPGHRRIVGHRTEDPRLLPQQREIGHAVPTHRDRHRQIQQDFPRIMRGQRFA